MQTIQTAPSEAAPKSQFRFIPFINSTLLIAGTTVGAGMLGIPLVCADAGFLPSTLILVAGYLFMLATGYLFLEVALKMPEGSNILSMAGRYLGKYGQIFSGAMFLFLYTCLMVAYFAALGPLLGGNFGLIAAAIFGCALIFVGTRILNRVNGLLVFSLIASYILLLIAGSKGVQTALLSRSSFSDFFLPLPVLFSAFGFHNIIPSITTYCKRDKRTLIASLLCGTAIPLLIYISWQWMILGSVSGSDLALTASSGKTAASALASTPYIAFLAKGFALFAIITSLLGVALSVVDFICDGAKKLSRTLATLLTFVPPLLLALLCPKIFTGALGLAGGIGEAFLNGILPVMLVYSMRYHYRENSTFTLPGGKSILALLLGIALFVMSLEITHLLIR